MADIGQYDIVKALRIIRRNDLPSTFPIELIDDAIIDWMRKFRGTDQLMVRIQDNLTSYRARRGSGKAMPGDHVRAVIGWQPTSIEELQRMEKQ